MKNTKCYIGDGIYAEFDGSMLKLTTEDGFGVTNVIFMELVEWEGLKKYMDFTAAKLWVKKMSAHIEELVSANRRKWLVAIQPKGMFREPKPQVLIVHAFSLAQAKRQAFLKMAKGRYTHRTPSMWEITSCEELKDEPSNS